MVSSDDEAEFGPQSVSNYHFVDDDDAPTSFSVLPLHWSKSEDVDEKKKEQIFVHGSVDNRFQTIHKEVTAWKFDLLNANPEISVLTKENSWIKLEKPRKSFEEIIRTVLITVHCLHFASRNPDASEKSIWDRLSKVFSFYEVRPSQNDLVDHMALVSESVKQDQSLAKSKVFQCASATCGYFYHPHCIAKLLHQEGEGAEELEKNIAAGQDSFICPIHKCVFANKERIRR